MVDHPKKRLDEEHNNDNRTEDCVHIVVELDNDRSQLVIHQKGKSDNIWG